MASGHYSWNYEFIRAGGLNSGSGDFAVDPSQVQSVYQHIDQTIPTTNTSTFESGYESDHAVILITAGVRPQIKIQGEVGYNTNGADGFDLRASMFYRFGVNKNYAWIPDGTKAPIKAVAGAEASSFGTLAAPTVTGRLQINWGQLLDLSVDAWPEGDPPSSFQSNMTYWVDLGAVNVAQLDAMVTAGYTPGTGVEQFSVVVDPLLQIDPDAIVTIDGNNYRATDLFTLSLSPGFTAAPEPGTLALLGIAAIGIAAYAWRRRNRCP